MPKREDLNSVLIIGSGPIRIGQACEFDYSGTQAIKALKEEGIKVILVNSNPATIMTDPEFADKTYIEPITAEFVEEIIKRERPDAILSTMGGQVALNTSLELAEKGVLEKYNCKLIGANVEAIKTAEDRELFKEAMDEIGLESAKSEIVHSVDEAIAAADKIGYPVILRPSRTLGGTGGSVANTPEELPRKAAYALSCSPNHEVLIEESLLGWKEIELEVMRDRKDNVVMVCTIENFDPMGVHTGDSITVAPAQTLTQKEYQLLRDGAMKVMRRIGVDSGGSNVQFAVDPKSGRMVVIEMNPRVSRSSALASKATGFPIAKISTKLAIGYTLDELSNDITKDTSACFEPSIDYIVVKVPRFNFEKFPLADDTLGTQMKSIGEVMSFGRNFREALQKAICSMEQSVYGFDKGKLVNGLSSAEILESCKRRSPKQLWLVGEALRAGCKVEDIFNVTKIDPWFLAELNEIILEEKAISGKKITDLDRETLLKLKRSGFSDLRLAVLLGCSESDVRNKRREFKIKPSYLSVDTCAAEFEGHTPYLYSSYAGGDDAPPTDKRKIIILGSGPNRIGQGIEFDYCCVHAVMALAEDGYETIMVNCNPETVSTDYDISDRLYFEPLTFESVMSIVERERPEGVIVQFGGQTPLRLANALQAAGVPIIGTSVESIDLAEDRKSFNVLIDRLGLRQPPGTTASSWEEAREASKKIGFPLMIRPSFVLGGRAMRVIHNEEELHSYILEGVEVSNDRPVLLDHYLSNAIEVDLDLVSDGEEVVIAGVMEHIERAGVHSGDSSCSLPPITLRRTTVDELKRQAVVLAKELKVVGLMNVQFAVTRDGLIYILEANPRASRTVPFVSKATGLPWAKIAARLMAGQKIKDLGVHEVIPQGQYAIKACVFPFDRFSGVDTVLGPEMKSTGEVMGRHHDFAGAFAKSQVAAGIKLPLTGTALLSIADDEKSEMLEVAEDLVELGFKLVATSGTANYLKERGFHVEVINKVRDGSPHIVDVLGAGKIDLVINTPEGSQPLLDSRPIRLVAGELRVPTYTTLAAAGAAVKAIKIFRADQVLEVSPLQRS
ncbi:MAG: carbamoyl-phosphate synthase large subunit [Bdellovibrionota bacterium]|jgi:carbamoyl-phosphate synthase large subunit